MDRLRLDSDPYAVDDRRVVAIEPERSDRVALLQMVEAGGSFGPLMESLGEPHLQDRDYRSHRGDFDAQTDAGAPFSGTKSFDRLAQLAPTGDR